MNSVTHAPLEETFLLQLVNRLIQNDQSLQRIYVNNRPEFGEEQCYRLAPRLVGSAVKKIIIQKTNMAEHGSTAIAEALLLTQVEVLRMWSNRIGDYGCIAFGKLLAAPQCCVTELILARNNIGNDGCRRICNGLAYNTSVTTVSLTANNISCYQGIVDMLSVNETIAKLNLIGNQNLDSPEVRDALVEAAESNFVLDCFVVWDYPILSVAQRQINFYTEFNKTGRRMILKKDNVPTAIWPNVLSKVKEADYIFYFLKAKPELFQNHKQGQLQDSSCSEEEISDVEMGGYFFRHKRRRGGDQKNPRMISSGTTWMC